MARATKKSTLIANMRANRLDRLNLIGIRGSGGAIARLNAEVLRFTGSGGPAAELIQPLMIETLAPIIRDGMVASHLLSRQMLVARAAKEIQAGARSFALQTAYDGSIDFLQKRLDMSDADLDQLREMYGNAATDALVNASGKVQANVEGAITQAAREGKVLRAAEPQVRQALTASGVSNASSFLVETLIRTRTQTAFIAGRWNALMDPDVAPIVWGFEYVTVGDDRVRPRHRALEGFTAPKNDPRWAVITPPNGWNCRCDIVEIFTNEGSRTRLQEVPEVQTIDGMEVRPEPDDGFAFNPGLVFQDMITNN